MTFLLLSPLILNLLTNLYRDIKFLFKSYVNLKFQSSGLETEDFFQAGYGYIILNLKQKHLLYGMKLLVREHGSFYRMWLTQLECEQIMLV